MLTNGVGSPFAIQTSLQWQFSVAGLRCFHDRHDDNDGENDGCEQFSGHLGEMDFNYFLRFKILKL